MVNKMCGVIAKAWVGQMQPHFPAWNFPGQFRKTVVRYTVDLLSLVSQLLYLARTHARMRALSDQPPLKSPRALLGTATATWIMCHKDFVLRRISEEF